MIASASIGITAKAFNIHNGNLSSATSRRIMDIHGDESQPFNRFKDPDAMDTSLDRSRDDERNEKVDDRPTGAGISANQDAEAILERPREEESRSTMVDQHAHKIPKPYLTQDLLALFNLQPLVATVARVDQNGEKINKMRKSYEGKVKNFQLAGRNRAVKHEPGKLAGLSELMSWPEEEWQAQKVYSKNVQNGLSSETLENLKSAMEMQPGPVPNSSEWEDLLGHEKTKPLGTFIEQNPKKSTVVEASTTKTNGLSNGVRADNSKATSEIPRPKRSGKKRRYDEHSFEGYGEGFVDDEGDVLIGGGYSSGEGSRKSSTSKKRRKEYGPSNTTNLNERSGTYGVGMIGVGSGIGTYGR